MRLNWTLRISILTLLIASSAWRLSHAQDPPRRIEVVAQRFQFTPGEITLKKDQPVILVLTSKDVPHGLKLDAFNQVLKVKKGESSQVEFTPTQTGTFVAQCAVFCGSGHGSMRLTIHVTE
jgi:cytochrome c oxidase subunit II